MQEDNKSTDVEIDFKSNRKKHFIISGILLLAIIGLIATLGAGLKLNPNAVPVEIINKKANDFNVLLINGQEFLPESSGTINLNHFKGQALVLNFWASWCMACRDEAHFLEEAWQKYKDSGVKVVGIAIQDTPENALKFAKYYGKTYLLGLDEDGKAGIQYGITGVPETFFINKDGVIIHKQAGPVNPQLLDELIPKLIN